MMMLLTEEIRCSASRTTFSRILYFLLGQDIPATRRVVISSEEEMPADYSTTPGGTVFGTTPGGTKIVYERAFLINMRNSPLARTPPKNMPSIPGY